jgi:hypothetical protein
VGQLCGYFGGLNGYLCHLFPLSEFQFLDESAAISTILALISKTRLAPRHDQKGRGDTRNCAGFVSGHDFSRAKKDYKTKGFSP